MGLLIKTTSKTLEHVRARYTGAIEWVQHIYPKLSPESLPSRSKNRLESHLRLFLRPPARRGNFVAPIVAFVLARSLLRSIYASGTALV
jgi:hypothetical protein